ncbi:hypothetical protein JM946_17215 [Steroidobacter sp. S1-65]|uniref:Uncharacterized protein n=1 Tax=Steroidobacter gossypii TaxID=2805490 RepID=A0ABS1WZS1_9GAMM|nr:hypothetical protein [Steroidobacter gossypii]MBM0106471.1 hypothetical protein [Steroidobacter gossypii]
MISVRMDHSHFSPDIDPSGMGSNVTERARCIKDWPADLMRLSTMVDMPAAFLMFSPAADGRFKRNKPPLRAQPDLTNARSINGFENGAHDA